MMRRAIAHHPPTDTQLVPQRRYPTPTSPFLYYMGCPMVWNTPLATLGQLSCLCPLPTSCAPPAFLLAGHEKLKNP